MTYDLAVFEGDPPVDDRAAADEFRRLYETFMKSSVSTPPTARIAAYAQALLARYPDIGTEAGVDSPWATGSLLGDASGPLMYFPIVWSRSEDVPAWAAQLAAHHGLHCYDPQMECLRTEPALAWRFELRSADGRVLRDPDGDAVRRVLVRLGRGRFWAVLTRADGWYVQVGFGTEAGARAGWYALERQEGAIDRHFRTDLSDITEVAGAVVGFLDGLPAWANRFVWRPVDLG